jgi:hypothetical protein
MTARRNSAPTHDSQIPSMPAARSLQAIQVGLSGHTVFFGQNIALLKWRLANAGSSMAPHTAACDGQERAARAPGPSSWSLYLFPAPKDEATPHTIARTTPPSTRSAASVVADA